jgi:hypothetical protein
VDAVHLSCPTLWDCTTQILPSAQSRVVVTLTDYNQERAADEWFVALVNRRFDEVVYWPQGPGDAAYIASLGGTEGREVLRPDLESFDRALREPDTAYAGLRLHGGIRAIQFGVPSLILSIDNRAREIRESIGLAAPSRHALNDVEAAISSGERVSLRLPREDIDDWRQTWLA